MVTIPLSSNIVNLFYIVLFDVTMPIALTWFIAILLSSINLKIIHDDRKVLWLRQVPVPHLFNPGASTRLIGLAVALASGLVVILSIVGSFSINGVSARVSKEVSYIVDGATSEDALDFSQHVHWNETGKFGSSEFLALHRGIFCRFFNKNGSTIYSSFMDTETPQSEWTYGVVRNSLKCRVAQNKLETKIAVELKFPDHPLPWLQSCNVTVPPQSERSLVQLNPTLQGECPFRTLEFFCANEVKFFCAGWIESKAGIFLFIKEFPKTTESTSDTLFNSGHNHIRFTFSAKPPTESLRSIAYLMAVDPFREPERAVHISLLTLKRSGTVVTQETAERTVVNETLFVATITPALVITFGVALGACASRYLYCTKPGRSEYNSFLSARDMLFCALNEGRDEVRDEGNNRMGSSESCFVTTLDGEPYLVEQEGKKDAQVGI